MPGNKTNSNSITAILINKLNYKKSGFRFAMLEKWGLPSSKNMEFYMKKFLGLLFFLLFCCNINLVCEEAINTKENLNKATAFYNSNDYKNALGYYIKVVQSEKNNTGTTFYRLAYSWENVNPDASKYFSKFFSIAAYCFERDNDTKNKYYSYAINKEKKYDTTHTNLNETKIEKIINKDLTQKKIDYRKGKEKKKSDAPLIILALIIGLFFNSKFGSKSDKQKSYTNNNSYKHDSYKENFDSRPSESYTNIKYYCKYCGHPYSSIQSLTSNWCPRHPSGPNKGKHIVYQGSEKNKYYCEYCGHPYSSIQSLTSNWCPRHPSGPNKGKHSPYEGEEKSQYLCEYCGHPYSSIQSLTSNWCPRHPSGSNKGKHKPAR